MDDYRRYQQREQKGRTMDIAVQFLLQREADRKMRLASEAIDGESETLVTEQAALDLARWFAK